MASGRSWPCVRRSTPWDDVSRAGDLLPYLVVKGFVAIDGISLTITERRTTLFVALVAYTQCAVTLGAKRPGRRVNLEVDVIAKYVESLLRRERLPRSGDGAAREVLNMPNRHDESPFAAIPEAIQDYRWQVRHHRRRRRARNEGDLCLAPEFVTPRP